MKNAWNKKKAWCFAGLLLLLLCFVAWVGYPGKVVIKDPVEEPPELTLQTAAESLTAPWTQGRWQYLNWYGREQQKNKGGTSDQEKRWAVRQPDLTTAEGIAAITFALPPDEVAVARYNVADHSSDVCAVDEHGRFALAEGVWTYRITANWTDKTREHDGTAIYFVCIEKTAAEAAVVEGPPDMMAEVPEGSVSKSSFYFSWNYLQADGTEMGLACTPGMPEDWWNMTAELETQGQTASISFALAADEIDVTRYSVTDGSSVSWDVAEDQSIALSEGRWTYQIIARWTDESRPYHGWGKYTLCIEKK